MIHQRGGHMHGQSASPGGYGRGGIASGFLLEGSIVAPVPVLPLPRDGIRYLRSEERKRAERY